MQPLSGVDWERATQVRVTVNKGKLRFRFGTTDAKKNLNFNANDKKSGPPYFPGKAIWWPDQGFAQAGNPESESFLMPVDAAKDVFGWWEAPTEEGDLVGFTYNREKTRVALMWGGYKMPKGDGTMHPPMNLLGPPRIPHVTLHLLDRNGKAYKGADGREVVINPRAFYEFDDPNQYDAEPELSTAAQGALFAGLSTDELETLRELVKATKEKHRGKAVA